MAGEAGRSAVGGLAGGLGLLSLGAGLYLRRRRQVGESAAARERHVGSGES
jgi:LPXTG-motif cell wall-anchored protein